MLVPSGLSEAYLMLPGFFAGIAHAVLFPSVTAQGSSAFPNRYRGLGTTVMGAAAQEYFRTT